MTKKSRQKFKYLENKKSFWGETKRYFSLSLKSFQLSKVVSDLGVRLQKCTVSSYTPQTFNSQLKREDLKMIQKEMKFSVVSVLHCSKRTFLFKRIHIPDSSGGGGVAVLYIEIAMYILRSLLEFPKNLWKVKQRAGNILYLWAVIL